MQPSAREVRARSVNVNFLILCSCFQFESNQRKTNVVPKPKTWYTPFLVCPPFSSVQFSHSVMSDSLWPHRLQHTRPPWPSPTPGVYSNSCPMSRWCIQPSHPLSSPSSAFIFPSKSGSFPRSQFFISGGEIIAVSASVSVLPMNIQDWFPLRLTGWTWLRDWTEPISFWTCWTWVSVPICVLVENFLQVFTLQYLQNILATYPDK